MKHKEVQMGHYFVFVRDNKPSSVAPKMKRLLVKDDDKILPLINKPVRLEGVTITPAHTMIDPVSTVVTERDLYRAEQDVIHLFIAFPNAPKNVRLVIKYNGEPFTERDVQLTNGMAIETLSMLPAGSYSAQLSIGNHLLGIPTLLTVAEYTLAPLSARLISHTLKREVEQLWFELGVESYQKPYSDELLVTLLEKDREVTQIGLLAQSPGHYAGGLKISGDGPFRLRLIAANDAERVAEVVIPGSRKIERQVTIISELGQERCFSMMPEVNAVPLRGGYLTKGDFLATPLTVEEIITKQRLIQVNTNIDSLVLVSLDLTSGNYNIQEVGNVTTGSTITAINDGPMSTVFIGGFINGQPFEGYTTFIEPLQFQLSIDAPQTIRPRTDLVLRLTCESMENKTIPVLLSVRDERLTVRDKPEVSLGAAAKRAIDTATEGMNERAFKTIFMGYSDATENDEYTQKLLEEIEVYRAYDRFAQAQYLIEFAIERYPKRLKYRLTLLEILADVKKVEQFEKEAWLLYDAVNGQGALWEKALELWQGLSDGRELFPQQESQIVSRSTVRAEIAENASIPVERLDLDEDLSLGLDEGVALEALEEGEDLDDDLSLDLDLNYDLSLVEGEDDISLDSAETKESPVKESRVESRSLAKKSLSKEETMPSRTELPEILFYDIVSVSGTKEVVIPLSDSLATLTVETFAMSDGNWTQNQTTVVVDKPVRVDLELPLAVHPDDKVMGRLRAITSSRKARLTLTHNGNRVAFESHLMPLIEKVVDTPLELEFHVKSGTYVAIVTDHLTDETDSTEMIVGEPGKFKSYVKELGLLQQGETISLKNTDILNLRVLPTLDTPFDSLLTATAGYAHLCCEQTAAKILAATFMYLTAKNDGQRNTAEKIILAGIAREQKMITLKRGFTMYPNRDYISNYYSQLAVRYLWKLNQLEEIPNLSSSLRQAVCDGLSLADQAGEAHQMQRMPEQIHDIEDAYTLSEKADQKVRQYLEKVIDFSGNEITLKNHEHAVADRKVLAYAAACLIAIGDLKQGLKLANQVTRQFNEQGRLYSTEDSIAAIALMIQLKKSGIFAGKVRLRINGEEMTVSKATQLKTPVESIEVLEGIGTVEVIRTIEEDWHELTNQFPVEIEFRNSRDKKIQRVKAGDRTDLLISLPDGYQTGDLVHVALPACLSWIQGGGKVKRFTQDFEGKNELRIPLIVTSKIDGKQHFAVCVRNMFKEERASSPGILTVEGN